MNANKLATFFISLYFKSGESQILQIIEANENIDHKYNAFY